MGKNKSKAEKRKRKAIMLLAMSEHWSPKNKERFNRVKEQSTKVSWWECRHGHEWRAKVAQVRSGRLPLCSKCRELYNKLEDKE